MANELGQLVAAAESPRDGYLAYHNPNLVPKLRAERLEKLTSMSMEGLHNPAISPRQGKP